MKIRARFAAATAALSCICGISHASSDEDALSHCLLTKSSLQDKVALAGFLFAAAASHPGLSGAILADEKTFDEAGRRAGRVFQRLLGVDCRAEVTNALQTEGERALTKAMAPLGKAAFMAVLDNPAVTKQVSKFPRFVDMNEFARLLTNSK